MSRLAVKIAYLGDGFSGSQVQPSLRTVEGEVESNLELITKASAEELDLKFSSRTDKGVNALGNAISFNSPFEDETKLLKALNAVSDGVFYRSFCEVPDDFNVRYASGRTYRYILPSEGMDMCLARQCAGLFIGEHDFLRFCRPDNKPTVADVKSITLEEGDGIVTLTFEARYFLWNMIRRMSSAIERAAKGRIGLDDVSRALEGEEISFGVSRPDALTLMDVRYDWLEFTPVDQRQFSERRDASLFEHSLRTSFYDSLR